MSSVRWGRPHLTRAFLARVDERERVSAATAAAAAAAAESSSLGREAEHRRTLAHDTHNRWPRTRTHPHNSSRQRNGRRTTRSRLARVTGTGADADEHEQQADTGEASEIRRHERIRTRGKAHYSSLARVATWSRPKLDENGAAGVAGGGVDRVQSDVQSNCK